jgi:hypothetical protein
MVIWSTFATTLRLIFRVLLNRQSCVGFMSGARMRLLANQFGTTGAKIGGCGGRIIVMTDVLWAEPFLSRSERCETWKWSRPATLSEARLSWSTSVITLRSHYPLLLAQKMQYSMFSHTDSHHNSAMFILILSYPRTSKHTSTFNKHSYTSIPCEPGASWFLPSARTYAGGSAGKYRSWQCTRSSRDIHAKHGHTRTMGRGTNSLNVQHARITHVCMLHQPLLLTLVG